MSICYFLGAAVFWVPDIVIDGWDGDAFSEKDLFVLSWLLPCLVILAFLGAVSSLKLKSPTHGMAAMLLGMWTLPPPVLVIARVFSGGGISDVHTAFQKVLLLVVMTVLFPVYTLIISVYDGSTIALVMTSILLALTYSRVGKVKVPDISGDSPQTEPRSK